MRLANITVIIDGTLREHVMSQNNVASVLAQKTFEGMWALPCAITHKVPNQHLPYEWQ
jgi:hypothetical protein